MGGGGVEAWGPFVGHKPNWNFGNWLIIAALHVRGFNFDISPSSGSSFFYFFFGFSVRIGGLGTGAPSTKTVSFTKTGCMQSGGTKK